MIRRPSEMPLRAGTVRRSGVAASKSNLIAPCFLFLEIHTTPKRRLRMFVGINTRIYIYFPTTINKGTIEIRIPSPSLLLLLGIATHNTALVPL